MWHLPYKSRKQHSEKNPINGSDFSLVTSKAREKVMLHWNYNPREPTESYSYRSFWRQAREVSHVDSLAVPTQHHRREEAFLYIFPAFSIAVGTIFFTLEEFWAVILACTIFWFWCAAGQNYAEVSSLVTWEVEHYPFLRTMPWDAAKDPKWHFCTFCAMTEETGRAGCKIYEQSWNTSISTSRL